MYSKTPFINKVLALILTLVFSVALLISLLSFPIELVLLNYQNYVPVLEKEQNLPRYSGIISEILISQLSIQDPTNQLPSILYNQENLKSIFNKYVSSEWSLTIFEDITNNVINYLNFRIPNSSMTINIQDLKSALFLKSGSIAQEYISSLPNCSSTINEEYSLNNANLSIYQLAPCKPADSSLQAVSNPMRIYFEDFINRLPTSVSINGSLPFDKPTIDRYFYYYTLARWGLRLLPILTVCLLIAIALLLKSEKYVMLRWIATLLITLSGLGLIGFGILLIGFNQFVVLLINRYLNNLIAGFGVLLMELIQEVGSQTLVWVIISVAIVLAFGLFLLIVSRLFRPKTNINSDSIEGEVVSTNDDSLTYKELDQNNSKKVIQPETLEEIEAKENIRLKNKG